MFTFADFTSLLATLSLTPAFQKPTTAAVAGPPSVQSFIQTGSDASSSCAVTPYPSAPIAPPVFAPFDSKIASIYRYRKQQSVNLGSWFVQENWMAPSLFTCASGNRAGEHDVAAGWGNTTNSRQVLERHWDTWIQDADFAYLRSIGINTVRLPIGFWSLGPSYCEDTPFEDVGDVYENSWPRVMRAVKTAEGYGIGVLIDLHGAPGSQNGQSHSGTSDGKIGLFDCPAYMNKTIDVLTFLTTQFARVNNVVGIEILNEPQNNAILPDFYNRTLQAVRAVSPEAQYFPFYIHDAFNLGQYAQFVSNRTDFLVEDHHAYYVYTPSDASESAAQHTADVNSTILTSLSSTSASERGNLVIDEWSCALTPQSLKKESNPAEAQRSFCTEQMSAYASASAGWSFWSYFMEDCEDNGGWCFKQAVGRSLPQTFFSYPGVSTAPRDPLAPMGDENGLVGVLANLTASAGIEQIVALAFVSGDEYEVGNCTTATPGGSNSTDASPGRRGLGLGRRIHQEAIAERRWARFANTTTTMTNSTSTAPGPSAPVSNSTDTDIAPPDQPDDERSAAMSLNQAAIARGYQDGFTTSKVFAQYGMSRLGFVGQYILDSLTELVNTQVVDAAHQTTYTTWFLRGLSDGEAQITAAITNTTAVYSHT